MEGKTETINVTPNYAGLRATFTNEVKNRIHSIMASKTVSRKDVYPLVHAINMVLLCVEDTQSFNEFKDTFDELSKEFHSSLQKRV